MPGERALQSEAFAALKQCPTANYGTAGCGDRGARRQVWGEDSSDSVWINYAGAALKSDGGCQRALARAIRASDQSERRHVRRRLTPVLATRPGETPEAATRLGGSRSACRLAIPQRSVPERRRKLLRGRKQVPSAGLANQLAMQHVQSRRSRCCREP